MNSNLSLASPVETNAGGLLEPYQRYDPEIAHRVIRAYSEGKSLRAIAKMPGMPCRMTIRAWERERDDFRTVLAYARQNKAEWHAERAGRHLARVDPDSPFGAARVALARERSNYDRYQAANLDRATYGDSLKVDADVKVAALVAFVSNAVRSTTSVVDIEATPKVVPPDGADKDA